MRFLPLCFALFFATGLLAQSAATTTAIDRTLPEFQFDELALAGQMHFLASDYLQGRRTGSLGNEIAAEYIAAQLRAFGYAPLNGASYFQDVPLRKIAAPEAARLTLGDAEFALGDNLLVMRGPAAEGAGEVVYANYGWVDAETDHDDYAELDVRGKIVITRAGIPGDPGQAGVFAGIGQKAELAAERGALAVFEIYSLPFPWASFRGYLGGERMGVDDGKPAATIPYGFIQAEDAMVGQLQAGTGAKRGQIMSVGMRTTDLASRNVGGILRGSDPAVADEYMIMTAHFDHVGVGRQGGGPFTEEDSIFNGARDNAFGTISLLSAARAFAERKPRRSIVILAVTGEELGLLGSKYYADNPLLPLDQMIFNFNTDGAGYNDTSSISVIGMGRTGIDAQIERAAAAFNTGVISNPAPEQGLYDRSDNVSFAAKGIPALNFAPGMDGFDDRIFKYYHQVTDNPETIDMAYLKRYCQIFTLAARLIANRDTRPFWVADDKYEAAGKALYNQK